MKKTTQLMAIATLVLLFLSGCAPKAGVLTGKLVDEQGHKPLSEYTVLLCTVDTSNGTCRLNSRYQTTTIAGEFRLQNVPVGQYGVYIISVSTGIGTLLLRDAGQPLIIQLEKGVDFDMGTITLRLETPQ